MPVSDLTVIYRDPAELIPYAKNARVHSAEQVAQIVASIEEFGFANPILLKDDGRTIGAGHGRHAAAMILELEAVPTITLAGLTEEQWRAYVIADNQIALNATWDMSILAHEASELKDAGIDLSILGLSGNQLDELAVVLHGRGEREVEDDTPDPPANPTARAGDVWELGPHRLACGDCTDATVVAAALQGHSPNLMVTDPPYGVEYDPAWRNRVFRKDGSQVHGRAVGQVLNDDRADWRAAWAHFNGNVAYVWCGALASDVAIASLESVNLLRRSQIIWNKGAMVIGRGDYHWKHETCWYVVRKGQVGAFNGDRTQTTVWDISHRRSATGHSTQKPVAAMQIPIENNSKAGERVYEPFSGSGTTLIAAQASGRVCHAIELNPAYVDVAVLRWQTYTGAAARLAGDGRTFLEVTAERVVGEQPTPLARRKTGKKLRGVAQPAL